MRLIPGLIHKVVLRGLVIISNNLLYWLYKDMTNALMEDKIRQKHFRLCMYAIMQKFDIAQGHFSSVNLVPHADDLKK